MCRRRRTEGRGGGSQHGITSSGAGRPPPCHGRGGDLELVFSLPGGVQELRPQRPLRRRASLPMLEWEGRKPTRATLSHPVCLEADVRPLPFWNILAETKQGKEQSVVLVIAVGERCRSMSRRW